MKKNQKKVGENLLLLLEKANDVDKPLMLARAFKAFLEERIDYQAFKNLGFIIDALNMSVIPKLTEVYQKYRATSEFERRILTADEQHLLVLGLVSEELQRHPNGVEHEIRKTKAGKLFCDIALEIQTRSADDHELIG